MKPTRELLLEHTIRGGRVFLFAYPDNLVGETLFPSKEGSEKIEKALFALPGVKEIDGPYYNGVMAITVDDLDGEQLTDQQWREKIVDILLKFW